MSTQGIVRCWDEDEGWGVIDSPQTPAGCWAHFGAVAPIPGYGTLTPGAAVELEWEAAEQDGYNYRAIRVWPVGQEPVDDFTHRGTPGLYSSILTITFDTPFNEAEPDKHREPLQP